MKQRKRLGEMLLEAGVLTEAQLNEALAAQKRSNLKLGQFLIRQGVLTELQLVDLLSEQLHAEKYDPNKYPTDPKLAALIPADMARRHQVVPLMKKGNLLMVGMTDPLDIKALDAIEEAANAEVDPIICAEHELNQLMGNLYGAYSDLDGVLDTIEHVELETGPGSEGDELAGDFEVSSLQDMAEEVPVIRLVNSVLSQAIQEKASDIHISPEKDRVQVRFRIDGKLHEVPAMPKSMFLPVLSRLKILSNMDISVTRIPQDGRFTLNMQGKEVNIRASTIPTIYGENLIMRLLDMSAGVYTLDRLGMCQEDTDKIESMIHRPYGMILSTGPTGSGKSTSLYAILKSLNSPEINIITLEDPVEYRIENIRQVQLNRRAGMTFASGLRSLLRQDPDVIMVGEIRDAETATIAVQAALTGHRVLSTVHTNDAAGSITRLLDMGIEPFYVSSSLLVSFAQRLVRTICPYCKETYSPPEEVLAQWGLDRVEGANYQRGKGCFNCMDSGFKGRTGLFEILVIDEMVQDMILKKNSAQEIARAAKRAGKLRTLKIDAADKLAKGIITFEEAASAVIA